VSWLPRATNASATGYPPRVPLSLYRSLGNASASERPRDNASVYTGEQSLPVFTLTLLATLSLGNASAIDRVLTLLLLGTGYPLSLGYRKRTLALSLGLSLSVSRSNASAISNATARERERESTAVFTQESERAVQEYCR
jgi:hypothetical protein